MTSPSEPKASSRTDGANPWRARWIWCEAPRIGVRGLGTPVLAASARPRVGLFRRSFTLDEVPPSAPARIASDSRHLLFLNGVEIARGPIRGNPRRLHADGLDLTPHLRRGVNQLAVLVRFYAEPSPWWMPAPPTFALGAGCLVFEARLGDSEFVVTDDRWRALATDAWHHVRPQGIGAAPIESVDARELPAGWEEVDFDDSTWLPAVELGAMFVGTSGIAEPPSHPFGALPLRPIAQLGGDVRFPRLIALRSVTATTEVDDPVAQVIADSADSAEPSFPAASAGAATGELPLTLAPSAGVHLVTLDFAEQVAGSIAFEIEAAAGARIDLAAAEGLKPDARLDLLGQHSGLRYVARGHDDRFETTDSIGGRVLQLAIRGGGAPFVLRRLELRERLHPRMPGPAFRCSDPLLERIWAAGRRTVDLCSQDAYLDCPSREQRAWTGDSVVHAMVDLTSNGDWRLARRHAELAASLRPDGMFPMAVAGDFEATDSTFIPDWPLHWVHAVHQLHVYTGDREWISRVLAPAECLLRWFAPFQGRDGLLANVTGWVLIDWSAVSVAGTSGALNALYARALREFETMSLWLGDASRAAWARATWQRIASGFERLWDEGRGVYVDHLFRGEAQRPVSEHTNAAALCAGLVPVGRIPRVVASLTERERLVRASWLLPGRTTPPEDGDMYGGAATLVTGPPAPWWDVEHQIVAAQPFFRYVVHDALAEAGCAERIPALCRDWAELLERSPATLSETWLGGSRCHGWSATPTRDLITRTLGISPAEAGFARARIAPNLGDLDWAAGSAPTPSGWIHVHVERGEIEVETPIPVQVVTSTGAAVSRGPGKHRVVF